MLQKTKSCVEISLKFKQILKTTHSLFRIFSSLLEILSYFKPKLKVVIFQTHFTHNSINIHILFLHAFTSKWYTHFNYVWMLKFNCICKTFYFQLWKGRRYVFPVFLLAISIILSIFDCTNWLNVLYLKCDDIKDLEQTFKLDKKDGYYYGYEI